MRTTHGEIFALTAATFVLSGMAYGVVWFLAYYSQSQLLLAVTNAEVDLLRGHASLHAPILLVAFFILGLVIVFKIKRKHDKQEQ